MDYRGKRRKQMRKRGKFLDCVSYDCKKFIQLELAGLDKNEFNYKLLKLAECPIEIITDSGCKIRGKTESFGIDYVDVITNRGEVLTVLKDKIVELKAI